MAYEIKEVKSQGPGQFLVAKGTDGLKRYYPKSTVDALIGESKRRGVTNKYVIAGILATIGKESGFKIQPENMNYTAKRLLEIPGWASKFSSDKIDPTTNKTINVNDYDRQPEKIANYIYGGQWGPVKGNKNRQEKKWYWGVYGNSEYGDGFKYRGRGYNGITFKSGYEKKEQYIPGLTKNPDLMLNEKNSAVTAIAYYVDGDFKNKKSLQSKFGITNVNDFNNWDQALLCICNMTAGFGYATTAENVQWAFKNAKKVHGFLIEYLEKNPEGTTSPPENPSSTVSTGDAQTQQQNEIQEQAQTGGDNSANNTSNSSSGAPITNLTQFFKPTIVPTDITINLSDMSESSKKKVSSELGYMPLVYINNYEIKVTDLEKFKLYHKGILPVIETTFIDSLGLLKNDGIPKDDSKITIYINSRSKNLRSVHMDFKIFNFRDNGQGSYTIVGICNIPEMYIRRFASFGSKTSHEALQEIARQCGIGFCSNIQNSDDKMTWINTGFRNMEFVDNIMLNSYVSDQSFQLCYIDFYYNLCYVDVSKELLRDVSQDKMISAYGWKYKNGEDDQEIDEKVVDLLLSTDRSIKASTSYIERFELMNKSTKVSIKKSYRTKTKYYDTVKKELLIFDVESQTSDGSKSIILKGEPDDNSFFENNTNFYYSGKIDSFEDGQGNVHKNYNYSISQNRQNLDDIAKFSAKFYLPNPNHNLYLYQKVPVFFTLAKPTPAAPEGVLKRLTGDWLITGIEMSFISGKQYQIVTAILRELSLIKGEESQSKSRSNSGDDNQKSQSNELSPNDQASPEPTPNNTNTTGTTPNPSSQEAYPTGEYGDMASEIPEAPESPTKSTPSGFPIKGGAYSKNSSKKTQVIFHYTAGWQKTDKNQATIKTLFDRGLSYHYIIDVTGHIENLVPPEYKAYHAKQANDTSIGISMACLGSTSGIENSSTYKNRTGDYKLIENYVDYCDINLNSQKWRGIKRGQEVSEAQLVSLLKLLKYLRQRIPTLPAWNGLNESNFYTMFGDGKQWRKDLPGPTPRFVQFLKTNRW